MAFIDVFVYYIADIWLENRFHKPYIVFAICLTLWFIDLLFITDAGIYLVELCDSNAGVTGIFFQMTLICFMCSRMFGIESIKKQIFSNTQEAVPNYVWFSIKYLCPVIMAFLLFLSLGNKVFDLNYWSKYDCWWAYVVEWWMIGGPFLLVGYFYNKFKDENEGYFADESVKWLEQEEMESNN